MADLKATFGGRMPEHYDRHLGPVLFDPFAAFLVERVPARPGGDVLEIACGTGLVTRRLRKRLDPGVRLVATDLSKAMLAYARDTLPAGDNVEWREADATRLPFADGEFGAVVCGFGMMFARDLATGQLRGTPRSALIEKRGVALEDVIDKVAKRLAQAGGDPYRGRASGFIVEARAGG